MGGFLDKPATDKQLQIGSGNGMHYCVSSMQGWRMEMEDAHAAQCCLAKPFEDWAYFAVFDGHAGNCVSAHCADQLLTTIMGTEEFAQGQHSAGIRAGFLKIDEQMRSLPLDKPGGTTAICVLVSPKRYYFANCGDSRAVLSRRGQPAFCTRDHKPVLPLERARIQKAGGSVMIQRVNGTLAVSRALGDYDFKSDPLRSACEQLVSPEPELTKRDRCAKDEFLVVACDGIWDVMSSEEVCAYIHSRMHVTENLPQIVNSVLDVCLYRGSRDNMSLLLVALPGAPQISADAQAADKRLDLAVAELTREMIEKHELIDFEDLMRLMNGAKARIKHLPPGAGIHAKFHVIERVFRATFPDKPPEFFEYYTYAMPT